MTYRIRPEKVEERENYYTKEKTYKMVPDHVKMLKKIRTVAKKTKAKILYATYDELGWLIVELR